MIHGEILMQSVWIAPRESSERKAEIASDIGGGRVFDDFNSREINANSSHGLHRMQFAINLTARIYYIMQQHPLNAPSGRAGCGEA